MRKQLLSLITTLLLSGFVLAAEVVFVKYDAEKKSLTVKEGEKEATYKITDATKVSVVESDGTAKKAELKVLEKVREGKTKMEVTTDKDAVTEIKVKIGKKGKE